jgi:hypothetical protein
LRQGDFADLAIGGRSLLLASPAEGLLLGAEEGLTWRNVTPNGLSFAVGRAALAFSPSHPQAAVAAGSGRLGQSAWLTLDGGATWQPLAAAGSVVDPGDGWQGPDLLAHGVSAVTFDPLSPRRLWLGDEFNVWGTHDGAATWFSGHAGLALSSVASLALDPRGPGRAFGGTLGAGAFELTADAGRPLAAALGGNGVELTTVPALAAPTRGLATLLAGRGDAILWQWLGPGRWQAATSLPGRATALAEGPDGGILAEVAGGAPQLTLDGGASWQVWGGGPRRLPVFLDRGRRLAAALGWPGGLSLTRDGGETWEALDGELPAAEWSADDRLAALPAGGGVLLVSHGGGVWRTRDEGRTWDRVLAARARLLTAAGGRFYLTTEDGGGLLASDDQGETWEQPPGAPRAEVLCLAQEPGPSGRLWLGTRGDGAWVGQPAP